MYYHIKVKFDSINESGKTVIKNEEYLVKDCLLHAEAEQKGYEYASEYQFDNPDVTSVKRSNIREFINEEPAEGIEWNIYDVTICDIFIDEVSGKEKELKYHVGVYATSIADATKLVHDYMRQGLNDMKYIAVKETKILGIL